MTVDHRMADRLQELLQQRALIKEHLDWLEGEISAASGRPVAGPDPLSSPPRPLSAAGTARGDPVSTPTPNPGFVSLPGQQTSPVKLRDDADKMIAQLAAEENTAAPLPTKKGCWIFFCVMLVILGVSAWAALRYFYRE